MQTKRRRWERGEPGRRTPPVGPVSQHWKGRGLGTRSPLPPPSPQHTPSPRSAPYPRLGPDPTARSENRPARRCPHPQLLSGRGSRSSRWGGVRAGGARGPGGAPPYPSPPRAAGREQRFRGCRAGAPVRGWAARLGSGAWLSRITRLPSGEVGRVGGRGREIRSHNIGLSPSPPQTFRRGWGSRGQFGGLGEDPGLRPDSTGDPRSA